MLRIYYSMFALVDVNSIIGNLLIRPSVRSLRSRYNFEIVLLDHGLYFDLDDALRVNYSRFWLSLIAPASAKVNAERRKYAELFGNIGPDLVSWCPFAQANHILTVLQYPVFEAALTGTAIWLSLSRRLFILFFCIRTGGS